MSDFDPYAYASSQGQNTAAPPPAFDPYAYAASTPAPFVPQPAPAWLVQEDKPVVEQTPVGMLVGKANEWLRGELTKGARALGVTDPNSLRDIGNLPVAVETVLGGRLSRGKPTVTEAPATAGEMTTNPQSISAAAATPNLVNASPELKEAVSTAVDNGAPVNAEVLNRHLQAESLPVPARLTKGQATQDPVLISQEQNQRGLANGAFAQHFNAQNQNLADNMQTMRDEVGPDVHSTNQVEHGDTLIKAYQAKDAKAEANIAAKYKALKDANGGSFPVDAKALKANVEAALHQQYLYEHAPSAEMAQLDRAASKEGMTFEQYEAMRTNLARTMRSSGDPNERAAAGVIRQQMENLPLTGGAANLKPLADAARAAAKARFDAISADPAYKAVVTGRASPDSFVRNFIVNGDRDDVALMRQNLADNDKALQTMGVGALDYLKKSARLDDEYRGNFAAQSYNKALREQLGPKLPSLFTPKQAEDLANIGDVARYETAQPKGSFVNNSNTATSLLAEHGKGIAEQLVNAKTLGIGGTLGRKFLSRRAERSLAKEHLSPGAGITWQPSGAAP